MKKSIVLSFAVGITMLFAGCTGPAGAPGPEGPQGATGANGVSGLSLNIYAISAWSFNPSPAYYYASASDAAITDPNFEAVDVYFSLGPNGPWQAIPASNALSTGDQLTFSWTTGSVNFFYDFSTAPAVTVYFNVAVIPPSIMKQHPNTNWKDGAAVMKLPEMQAAMQAGTKK